MRSLVGKEVWAWAGGGVGGGVKEGREEGLGQGEQRLAGLPVALAVAVGIGHMGAEVADGAAPQQWLGPGGQGPSLQGGRQGALHNMEQRGRGGWV